MIINAYLSYEKLQIIAMANCAQKGLFFIDMLVKFNVAFKVLKIACLWAKSLKLLCVEVRRYNLIMAETWVFFLMDVNFRNSHSLNSAYLKVTRNR